MYRARHVVVMRCDDDDVDNNDVHVVDVAGSSSGGGSNSGADGNSLRALRALTAVQEFAFVVVLFSVHRSVQFSFVGRRVRFRFERSHLRVSSVCVCVFFRCVHV